MTIALNLRIQRYYERKFNIMPAFIRGDNPASESVLRKCGFIRVDKNILGSTFVRRICMNEQEFAYEFLEI
jgi:hypothetical protein